MPGTAMRSAGVKSLSEAIRGTLLFSDNAVVDSPDMPITSTFGMPRARAQSSMNPGAPALRYEHSMAQGLPVSFTGSA